MAKKDLTVQNVTRRVSGQTFQRKYNRKNYPDIQGKDDSIEIDIRELARIIPTYGEKIKADPIADSFGSGSSRHTGKG